MDDLMERADLLLGIIDGCIKHGAKFSNIQDTAMWELENINKKLSAAAKSKPEPVAPKPVAPPTGMAYPPLLPSNGDDGEPRRL